MKKMLTLCALFSTLSFGVLAGGPDEPVTTNENVETVTLTVEQIKEMYGLENVVFENGAIEAGATVTLQKQLYPCGDPNFFPCDGALAQARQLLQQQANACCCDLVFGIECCDPSTGSLRAILFIVQPNSPSCN
ncbi:MAG: hypothetical protein NXI10_17380 [bacterium]|nr:hypothetical protein [bacterium]